MKTYTGDWIWLICLFLGTSGTLLTAYQYIFSRATWKGFLFLLPVSFALLHQFEENGYGILDS